MALRIFQFVFGLVRGVLVISCCKFEVEKRDLLNCNGMMGVVQCERCDTRGQRVAMGAREVRLERPGDRYSLRGSLSEGSHYRNWPYL